jgi:hypothetical protein
MDAPWMRTALRFAGSQGLINVKAELLHWGLASTLRRETCAGVQGETIGGGSPRWVEFNP